MNVVFCDKRDCVFWDVDGICNCVMHDGIPYCKSESIDTKNDAADGLKEENAKLRELLDYMTPIAWYAASERERDRMRELGVDA